MRKAAIWLADEQHQSEVQRSMASVKDVMPDLTLINDIVPRTQKLWYADWLVALLKSLERPIDQYVFFDSDVYACAPFGDIFEVLNNYDLTSTHAPARQTTDMPADVHIPDAFCEFNTGVFGYRNLPVIKVFFAKWLDALIQYSYISGDNDQSALRIALWQYIGLRVWVMPPEYNCRFGFGGFAAGEVKILHGRSSAIGAIAKHINLDHTMRTWERGFYS